MRSDRHRRWRRFTISRMLAAGVLFFLPLLFGCGNPVMAPALTPEEIPHFTAAGNFPDHIYRIEPGDTIQIRYTFHPDMNQEIVVLPDGKIGAQLVGEIAVSGMTTKELETSLVQRTSDSLREPEVIVSVTKFAEKPIYVGGEVQKPGIISYRKGLSPLQAIIAAGGFLDSARTDSVILIRPRDFHTDFISRKLNLAESITGIKEPLVFLAPHDLIYVPRSSIAEADLWVKQHITELFPFLKGSAGYSYRAGQ
jgi:protein involved in polysaccharide export with SLBB domain